MAAAIHHSANASAITSLPTSYLSEPSPSLLPPPHISTFLCPSHPKPKTKPQNLSLFTESNSNPTSIFSKSLLKPIFNSKPIKKAETELSDSDYSHLLRLSVRYGDTELAKTVHAAILKLQEDNTYLSNAVISAYLKLFHLSYANRVFAALRSPDVVSYTAMISGFAKSNRENEAIELFFEMRDSGIEPNEYTCVALLTACMRLLDLELGYQVHAFVVKLGFLDCTYVANALMGLYSNCGCLGSVIELFNEIPLRDIVSWNTVISSLVKEGMNDEAFQYFHDMLSIDGLTADYFTLSSLLVACSACAGMREGGEIHGHAIKIGYQNNLSVNNALIRFYTKCGNVEDVSNLFGRMLVKDVFTWTEMITAYMEYGLVNLAEEAFDMMPERNCVSYNALLGGYCQNEQGLKALSLFCNMVEEGIELNDFTLTTILKACALTMQKETSEQIHGFLLKFGFGSNYHIEAALLDMCTWCGRMDDAEKILHQWPLDEEKSIALTTLVCGYARNAELEKAISLFSRGQSGESLALDEVASTTSLGICGVLGLHKLGEQIHCCSLKKGHLSDVKVGNSAISMYSKCGEIKDAIRLFDVMPWHDIVSWNCLLAGHILHRQGDETLAVWEKMEKLGIKPDSITCLYVISAYKHTSSNLVGACRSFFNSMDSAYNIQPSTEHYAHLVGVLGYWGLLDEAEETIHKMPFPPKASVWRVLLDCCRMHLNITVGKRVAKEILSIEPHDPSTFILRSNLLSASGRWHCSEQAREEMREKGFRKIPGRSWIIHDNKVHSFFARDSSHPLTKDIHSGLEILILECLKSGYVPDTSFVLHEVEEHQKKNFLYYHSAKLAVTYGLLMTRPGKPIRVMKNILLCGDCHTFLKHVSVVTKREIHVRDASGFHYFSCGNCTCKEPK